MTHVFDLKFSYILKS